MILIDAEEIIWEINEIHKNHGLKDNEQMIFDETDVISLIVTAPTIDAVPVVHGRWIDNVDENGKLCNVWRKCSACGGLNYSKKPPYCPNCGAKMDGEADENLVFCLRMAQRRMSGGKKSERSSRGQNVRHKGIYKAKPCY